MSAARGRNLDRLLHPRHVALIGGDEAAVVAGECARIGFTGAVWPVHPRRSRIGGHACVARVEDLPEAPDAAFVAVPREAAIESLAALSSMGAGGAVCYTAGFGELGGEGVDLERRLVAAAGDMALLGPNCYGLINYLHGVALWPFAHGGGAPGYGAAIVTQSGMLSSDLTMSQRSLPLSHMLSLGNQAVLSFEDLLPVLAREDGVRAIGLHVEGIRDVARFEAAVLECVQGGVPVVVLKTGTSRIGARLTVSHTGSLAGTDDLYQALFDRLGIIRVATPSQLVETLKFLCVAGVPRGRRLAGFTCSGGGATMLADHAETLGLDFPVPASATAERLATLLPHTATLSNPLDYTTPIWGIPERVRPVFDALLAERHDVAVLVQDYPLAGLDESRPYYLGDARCLVDAARAAGVPAAVCSTLPENLDLATREWLVAEGVAPMQGIAETLAAVAGAAWHGERRERVARLDPRTVPGLPAGTRLVDEVQGKQRLRRAGIAVPDGRVASGAAAADVAAQLGFPVALKMMSERLPHKTEAGAVRLGLASREAVTAAVERMRADVARHDPSALSDRFLVERMEPAPLAELLVNVRIDAAFGAVMTVASGGVLAELVADAATLLLPAGDDVLAAALARLRVVRLLDGYRGAAVVDRGLVVHAMARIAALVCEHGGDVVEVEVNPLFVHADRVAAVDVLMQVAAPPA